MRQVRDGVRRIERHTIPASTTAGELLAATRDYLMIGTVAEMHDCVHARNWSGIARMIGALWNWLNRGHTASVIED